MEKGRQQLRCLRDLLFADQLAIMQHQRKPQAVAAESKYDEKPKPLINIS